MPCFEHERSARTNSYYSRGSICRTLRPSAPVIPNADVRCASLLARNVRFAYRRLSVLSLLRSPTGDVLCPNGRRDRGKGSRGPPCVPGGKCKINLRNWYKGGVENGIEHLAEVSLTFTRECLVDALCRPSLATGLHPHQHGVARNDPAFSFAGDRYSQEWMVKRTEQNKPITEFLLDYPNFPIGRRRGQLSACSSMEATRIMRRTADAPWRSVDLVISSFRSLSVYRFVVYNV